MWLLQYYPFSYEFPSSLTLYIKLLSRFLVFVMVKNLSGCINTKTALENDIEVKPSSGSLINSLELGDPERTMTTSTNFWLPSFLGLRLQKLTIWKTVLQKVVCGYCCSQNCQYREVCTRVLPLVIRTVGSFISIKEVWTNTSRKASNDRQVAVRTTWKWISSKIIIEKRVRKRNQKWKNYSSVRKRKLQNAATFTQTAHLLHDVSMENLRRYFFRITNNTIPYAIESHCHTTNNFDDCHILVDIPFSKKFHLVGALSYMSATA